MPSTQSEQLDRFSGVIGLGSAAMTAVALTVVGSLALDNVTYGAITGVFVGAGNYLFVPWFIRLSAAQEADDELPFSELLEQVGGDPTTRVFGLGLELGGIAMFALGFTGDEANLAIGVPVAVGVALLVYLVGALLLD